MGILSMFGLGKNEPKMVSSVKKQTLEEVNAMNLRTLLLSLKDGKDADIRELKLAIERATETFGDELNFLKDEFRIIKPKALRTKIFSSAEENMADAKFIFASKIRDIRLKDPDFKYNEEWSNVGVFYKTPEGIGCIVRLVEKARGQSDVRRKLQFEVYRLHSNFYEKLYGKKS